jgi:hypothetical protein
MPSFGMRGFNPNHKKKTVERYGRERYEGGLKPRLSKSRAVLICYNNVTEWVCYFLPKP